MKASIERIKWMDKGSLVAFVDINFDGMMVSKGWKIMNSTTGRWLAPPSHQAQDGKYYPDILFKTREIGEGFQEHILALADKERNGATPEPTNWSDDGRYRGLEERQRMERPAATPAQPAAPVEHVERCATCGAKTKSMNMANGKVVIVNAESVPLGALTYDRDIMIRHDETCGVANAA